MSTLQGKEVQFPTSSFPLPTTVAVWRVADTRDRNEGEMCDGKLLGKAKLPYQAMDASPQVIGV